MRRKNDYLDIEANIILYKLQRSLAGKAIDNKKSLDLLLFRPLKEQLLLNKVRIIDISHEFITAKPIFKSNTARLRLGSVFEGVAVKMAYPIHRYLGVGKAGIRSCEANSFI
jgi:hypothetical protein